METCFIFLGSKSLWMVSEATKFKDACSLEEKLWQRIKSRDITLPTKVCLVKALVFPVVMYGCESWTIKKAEHWRIDAFWTVVLEKTLESPLDCKEIQLVHPKGHQYSLEGLMLKLKLQYFGHLMRRTDSFEKTLMLGTIEDRRRRGLTEDEMVGWHHWLNGHEFKQSPRDGEGQGSLACCKPWGCKESDMTEWLNSNSTPEMHKSSSEEWLWIPNPQASVVRNYFIHSLDGQVILSECTINP